MSLTALLDLERLDEDTFVGVSLRTEWLRAFGGQVASQALLAAGRTVDAGRNVHSLHSYFIRPGDSSARIRYAVERVRDGRSFATRRVTATQDGRAIFTLSASFQDPEPGVDHQPVMPRVPEPEQLPTLEQRLATGDIAIPRSPEVMALMDVRWVDESERPPRSRRVWMRFVEELPNDPLIHICALTYASDVTLLSAVLFRHGLTGQDARSLASLDHAMWFARPLRADEWFLYDFGSPTAYGGRGLAMGHFYNRAGLQAATVVQEGLVRLHDQG